MNAFLMNYLLSNALDRNGMPNKKESKAVQQPKATDTVKKSASEKKQ
jgi:hypothetical protein